MSEHRFFNRECRELNIVINDLILGRTKDVSLSGTLCRTNKFIEKGSLVNIVLSLPTGDIDLTGICNRCIKLEKNEYIVAIKFDPLSPTSKVRLNLEKCLSM